MDKERKNISCTVWISESEQEMLKELCEEYGVTTSTLMRELLVEKYKEVYGVTL